MNPSRQDVATPRFSLSNIFGPNAALSRRSVMLLAFGGMILFVVIVRLFTFEQYLPYLDNRLEGNMFLLTFGWRGLGDGTAYGASVPITANWLSGYPPLFVWINMVTQQLTETFSTRPWLLVIDYVYAARMLSVIFGTITTLLVAIIGWQISGPLAGWLAGLVWGFSPLILTNNNLATPDPITYLTCAASIAMALAAWRSQSPRWGFASLVAAVLAIYSKYPVVPVLLPWGLVTLYLIRKLAWRMMPWLALQAVTAAIAVGFLLFGHNALALSNGEGDAFRDAGLSSMFDLARNIHNWGFAALPIGIAPFIGVMLLAAIAFRYSRRQGWRCIHAPLSGILLVYSVVGVMMVSGFFIMRPNAMRHMLPIAVVLIPLWTAGLTQVIWTVQDWLRQYTRRGRSLAPALPLVTGGLMSVILLVPAVGLIHQYGLPHTIPLLWRWADTNMPDDGVILMSERSILHTVWNRPYSGYDGVTPFRWAFDDNPTHSALEVLWEQGVAYFMFTDEDRASVYRSAEMGAFIDQLSLLKTIPDSPEAAVNGPTIYIYRLTPPQNAVQFAFGDQIVFTGYDIQSPFTPGSTIRFRPYWRIAQPPDANYSMFIHLYAEDDDALLAQYDGAPTTPDRLTLTWDDANELYIGRDAELLIPHDLEPGRYKLAVGLYDFTTGQRLVSTTGADHFEIPVMIGAL